MMSAPARRRPSPSPKDASTKAGLRVLICRGCQAELSAPIRLDDGLHSPADFGAIDPRRSSDPSALPPGCGTRVRTRITSSEVGGEDLIEDRIWLNLRDICSYVELDARFAYGCCGPSGQVCRRCACGAMVGREYSDCLHPHYFSPEPSQTDWIDVLPAADAREAGRDERLIQASLRAPLERSRHNKRPQP